MILCLMRCSGIRTHLMTVQMVPIAETEASGFSGAAWLWSLLAVPSQVLGIAY